MLTLWLPSLLTNCFFEAKRDWAKIWYVGLLPAVLPFVPLVGFLLIVAKRGLAPGLQRLHVSWIIGLAVWGVCAVIAAILVFIIWYDKAIGH